MQKIVLKPGILKMPPKVAVLALLALFMSACAEHDSGLSGEELAAQYCTRCHLAPVPEQLPKESWPFVLQWMGNYLGFEDLSGVLGKGIVNRDIVPDEKLISSGDFSKIKDYYLFISVKMLAVGLMSIFVGYGGAEGLQRLVNSCHEKGIAVILDVVYNHLGPEGNYLGAFGPYFTEKYKTPWGPAINFDDA